MSEYNYTYAPTHPRARIRDGFKVRNHILVAEKALGRYLESINSVHHFDLNKKNDANTNLVICPDEAYHRLLHARQRTVKCGGNPDTQSVCGLCCEVKNNSEFYSSSLNASGLQSRCKVCMKETARRQK